MRLRFLPVLLAALLAGPAAAQPAASAEADTTTRDLRCATIALIALGAATTDQARSNGAIAFYYFVGRLDGGEPSMSLETRLMEAAAGLPRSEIPAQGQVCAAVLTERGRSIAAIAQHLQQQRAALPDTPAPTNPEGQP